MLRVKLNSGSFGEMIIEQQKLAKLGYCTEMDSYWHRAVRDRQGDPTIAKYLRDMTS